MIYLLLYALGWMISVVYVTWGNYDVDCEQVGIAMGISLLWPLGLLVKTLTFLINKLRKYFNRPSSDGYVPKSRP